MYLLYYVAFLSTTIAAPLIQVDRDTELVQGQYIIKFKQDVAAVSTLALMQSLSTPPKFKYSFTGFDGFAGSLSSDELAELQTSEQVCQQFRDDPKKIQLIDRQIEYIQPDIKVHAYDLVYQKPATWGISRISNRKPGNEVYVFDDSAGEGTCAYVIDTGIFVEHPDFEGRMLSPHSDQIFELIRGRCHSPRQLFRG